LSRLGRSSADTPSLKRTAATATSRFHDSRRRDCAWPATKKRLPIANRPRDFTGVRRMRRNRNALIVTPITRVEMLTSSCLTARHLITRQRILSFGMLTKPCHAMVVTRKMRSFATPPSAASIVTKQTNRTRGVLGKRVTIVMARSHGVAQRRSTTAKPCFRYRARIAMSRAPRAMSANATRESVQRA